jgi:hypothetical protein
MQRIAGRSAERADSVEREGRDEELLVGRHFDPEVVAEGQVSRDSEGVAPSSAFRDLCPLKAEKIPSAACGGKSIAQMRNVGCIILDSVSHV